MRRVAVISLHTSPLLQPGSGDSGGMNVYVREMVSSLAQAGVECTTYTRCRPRRACRARCWSNPTTRVVHVEAGPHHLPKEALPDVLDEFTDGVLAHIAANGGADVVHANYWLERGRRPPHQARPRHPVRLDLPHAGAGQGRGWRSRAWLARHAPRPNSSTAPTRSASAASRRNSSSGACTAIPDGRIEIVAPGVEHAFFAPGERSGARAALDLPVDVPVILFVGRIQPLKGPDVAIRALHALGRARRAAVDRRRCERHRRRRRGRTRPSTRRRARAARPGAVRAAAAAPHPVDLLPRRRRGDRAQPQRELRAGRARGRGVRHPGRRQRGRRVAVARRRRRDRLPDRSGAIRWSSPAAIARILDDPLLAASMSVAAAARAKRYTWSFAAARLRRLYTDLTARQLVVVRMRDTTCRCA